MLTGERLFKGEDTVQVLSRVLEQPVDLDSVPQRFRKLLARCLDRNPKDRLRDIGEARFLLEDEVAQLVSPDLLQTAPLPSRRGLILGLIAAGAVLLVVLGILSLVHF